MNGIFDRFEKMLNFVLEDTKQTIEPNIRRAHLLCAAPINRKYRKVTSNFSQNSGCFSPTLGNGCRKVKHPKLGNNGFCATVCFLLACYTV